MKKSKITILRARLNDQHVERIEAIGQITGMTISQVMRRLIENAQVAPAKMEAIVYPAGETGQKHERLQCVV